MLLKNVLGQEISPRMFLLMTAIFRTISACNGMTAMAKQELMVNEDSQGVNSDEVTDLGLLLTTWCSTIFVH